jgi:hypothetical protein
MNLQDVPKRYYHPEILAAAVSAHWQNLKHIDETDQTEELCIIALQKTITAMEYIKIPLTDKMKNCLLTHLNTRLNAMLVYVPKKYHYPEIVNAAITANWENLQFVEQINQTEELCLIALQQNMFAIRHMKIPFTDEMKYNLIDMCRINSTVDKKTQERCLICSDDAVDYYYVLCDHNHIICVDCMICACENGNNLTQCLYCMSICNINNSTIFKNV